MSLESIQPGGAGHMSCIRVRFLHATVRQRILSLAKTRPEYYDVSSVGIPINDLDSIGTISTFSAQLIWLALPAQGVFMKTVEIEDYIAMWRLVAYYMGTPTDPFATPQLAKAYMDSILKMEISPSESSKVLANNIINSLADQPPIYGSASYLRAVARWLNGPYLSDALDIPKPPFPFRALVIIQCLVFSFSSYFQREIPYLDKRRIGYMRKAFYRLFITGEHGLNGKLTKFEMQYRPEYNSTSKEEGETGSLERTNSIMFWIILGLISTAVGVGAWFCF
jgi:hypothetical protein